MVWIQIRTDVFSVLIWVQTVCKGYQQTKNVVASKQIFKVASNKKYNIFRNVDQNIAWGWGNRKFHSKFHTM